MVDGSPYSPHQLSRDDDFPCAVFNSSTVFGLSVVCESIIIVQVVLSGNLARGSHLGGCLLSLGQLHIIIGELFG